MARTKAPPSGLLEREVALSTISETRSGVLLPCAVEIEVRDGKDCEGDPQLATFVVTDGPAVAEIESVRSRLLAGTALDQKVVLAKRVDTGALLGFANVRKHEPFSGTVPPWLAGLRSKPYIGVLARDDRYFKCRLADEETWLGVVLVRSVIELETAVDEAPATFWAVVQRGNGRSRRAFCDGNEFERHPRSHECGQDVLVRPDGLALPPPPSLDVYSPPPRPRRVQMHEVGRNDPCWCESGKKFKKCHGA
jgi:hypothetical protein